MLFLQACSVSIFDVIPSICVAIGATILIVILSRNPLTEKAKAKMIAKRKKSDAIFINARANSSDEEILKEKAMHQRTLDEIKRENEARRLSGNINRASAFIFIERLFSTSHYIKLCDRILESRKTTS